MSGDPFPMRSEAALRLGAAEDDGPWSPMATRAAEAAPHPRLEPLMAEEANDGLIRSSGDHKLEVEEESDEEEDGFLDRPVWESRSPTQRRLARCRRVFERLYQRLYGDKLPAREMLRTLCLACTLFYMIGGYWIMRSLKDPILTSLCGVGVIPKAKMLSVVLVLAVVSIYNKLLDTDIPRHKLFYIFGTFYFFLFMAIALLLKHPTVGLANQRHAPDRLLGWATYCTIESYGSIMVSLFWSFTNSNFSLESAKASYGVLIACAQVGSILGPTFVNRYAETIGVANCYVIGACCLSLLQFTMYVYIRIYGPSNPDIPVKAQTKPGTGVFEGLQLFWRHNYIKGIFVVSCMFMVVGTTIDYIMKMLARDYFAEEHPCEPGMSCFDPVAGEHGMSEDATAAFTSFMGLFGQAANTLSFLISLFGTSIVIRALGLRYALLLFPCLCFTLITVVRLHPTLGVCFGAMMAIKSGSYALNNPTKEILYQPTSASVKYKAKSWIDIVGARGAKATASVVTNAFSYSLPVLVQNGSLVAMLVSLGLVWNATYMGRKFEEYTTVGYVVGDDPAADDEDRENLRKASRQNEAAYTSCASHEEEDDDDDFEAEG